MANNLTAIAYAIPIAWLEIMLDMLLNRTSRGKKLSLTLTV